ncbi:MAG TPA: hypothetical protein VN796_02230 [Acidimicrobiales bacterium]|nr:hypothetical protein [Acidimicrobiales bacterium]
MPVTTNERRGQGQYQPPLPGTAAPGLPAAAADRRVGTDVRRPTTKRRRSTAGGRADPRPVPAPHRSSPVGAPSWRLDEKTRLAGRRGVAAARAALAGTAPSGDRREANAA